MDREQTFNVVNTPPQVPSVKNFFEKMKKIEEEKAKKRAYTYGQKYVIIPSADQKEEKLIYFSDMDDGIYKVVDVFNHQRPLILKIEDKKGLFHYVYQPSYISLKLAPSNIIYKNGKKIILEVYENYYNCDDNNWSWY